ncbi:PilC/PilY family type IV pilus protein [Microbulbifer pacificus]|uniref:PilC/PilY family type IV pilus protein n=1 Tax=Microbulbifer pacificus TaxID=407164 RepID=A0AAU0N1M1_9GAMM|nr:PilC/PilY family type IV pilus protein [Microbulbifer pacificus]WOX06685.1 PilC/PilY family type IV pilus protein [Microbulbifer pacificus]
MNNKLIKKFSPKPLLYGLFGFSFAYSTCVSADPLTLSNVPLQATGKVEPNLMILMDSSGSMAWEVDSNSKPANEDDSRLGIAKVAATTVVKGLGDLRVGLAQFNGSSGAKVLKGLTSISEPGVRDDLITKIEAIDAGGKTPLAEAVSELGRYYIEGYQGDEVTIHPGQAGEANVLASSVLSYEPAYASAGDKPTTSNPAIQQYCQKNFILTLTDGLPTEDKEVSSTLKDYDDDCAASDDDASCFSYSDDGSDYLDDVATALYDINWRPYLVDPKNSSHKNNIVSHFIGFADPALANNQLLKNAGAQGGGSYKYADSAATLLSSLNDAVNAISNSVGTQASVAFNSTSLDIGSVIYSAKFDTSDFSGRLYARSLDPDTGRIASTLWEASEKLADESSNSREIITYRGGKGVPFTATGVAVDGDPSAMGSSHEEDLSVLDTTDNTTDTLSVDRLQYVRGNTDNDTKGDFRQRGAFSSLLDNMTGPKLLGDIVHSTPIYVGKPELNWPSSFGGNKSTETYDQFKIDKASRDPMVYVGANDGMLHGFNAKTGEEEFAYLPALVLNSDRYKGLHAFTHKDYPHNYYVDLTPTVSDVYIDPNGSKKDEWVSVLVGGLRGGGKGYFALNITDPTKFDEANADLVSMWEFDGATDSDYLGYSYSEAQIAKLNNDEWAVIFGNGYNSKNGIAGLFVVYLERGVDGTWDAGDWKFISTGVGTADTTVRQNGLSSPRLIDLNGDRKVDRVYAGDLMGNMWSFDLSATTDTSWGIYGGKPLFSSDSKAGQPSAAILSAPLVARNTAVTSASGANVLVMFGTGQYLNGGDLTDNNAGAFYAVWDNGTTVAGASVVTDNLANQMLKTEGANRVIDDENSVVVDWSKHKGWMMTLATGNVESSGYAGERIISSPSLRRNTLFFSTVSPNPQPCASSGSGYLMSLDFRTGQANDKAVADFNNDGEINAQDHGYIGKQFVACTKNCGEDGASGGDPGMPGQSGFIGDVRCTPGSSGDVICDDIDVGNEEREGRLSWEEFSPR